MKIEPGNGPLWKFLKDNHQILNRLIEWGETSDDAYESIDGRCPICEFFPNCDDINELIPDWIIGYSTRWKRSYSRVDAGAWVIKCERCGTKFCNHIHDLHTLEKFLQFDPKWPKA